MAQETAPLQFHFVEDKKILIGEIFDSSLDKENAKKVYEYTKEEAPKQPDYNGFVLNVLAVSEVSDAALGYLMKSLDLVKKVKGYMILVMTETLLQDVMMRHPILFDYYAVFHTIEEAITYIDKEHS